MDRGTRSRLSALTDPGTFELLATAVLREAGPTYAALVQTGVNEAGRTVRAALDGVAFVPGADPPHMVAVHHTTCARRELERKWLAVPSGDLPKTAAILAEERARTPSMRATLVLTTNEEPPGDLVRCVASAAREAGMGLDLWPASRLAHFLDFNPQGQWIRRHFLGVPEERLSGSLLRDLSRTSLELSRPPDDPDAWIDREVDQNLGRLSRTGAVFVAGESGLGKSIACFRRLAAHVDRGGYGLIVPHDVVAAAMSLDQAIGETLRRLHPSLAEGEGSEALALASPDSPMMLVVEDVNRSEQPAFVLEKIASWHRRLEGQSAPWQLFCPVWPDVIRLLGEEERRRVEALSVSVGPMSPAEGATAVLRRRALAGERVTRLEAEQISAALGHDPLLIAIWDPRDSSAPGDVLRGFIRRRVDRLAASARSYTATDYFETVISLASKMLERHDLDPAWKRVCEWFERMPETVTILRDLVHAGDVLRLTGTPPGERVGFRHDRLRNWLLVEACARQLRVSDPPEELVAEPYFAEILGDALARGSVPEQVVEQIARENPLALFHAMREFREPRCDTHRAVLSALQTLVGGGALQGRANQRLRWDASKALAGAESPHALDLVRCLPEQQIGWYCLRARFRNGDFVGGVGLCWQLEPGVRTVGHIELIEHVRAQRGPELLAWLDDLLRREELSPKARIGALRLAGHLADPALERAVEASWRSDAGREVHLSEYLWACARCCGNDPAHLLGPVCDLWAALPDQVEEKHRRAPRDEVGADHVRWAFHQFPPRRAIPYLIERARGEDLRFQIVYLLHGVDDPDAVAFVVSELAVTAERLEGSDRFSPFVMSAPDDWQRANEDGRPMSNASRARLQQLWVEEGGRHLRKQAFRLWAVTECEEDLGLLRRVDSNDPLLDLAVRERIRRHDGTAIPELLRRLEGERADYWWQLGRDFWTEELTEALDRELDHRKPESEAGHLDWILAELVLRLPSRTAERLLVKHWASLRQAPHFVQAALYVATPHLANLVAETMATSAAPEEMLKFLGHRFGIRVKGHPGIARLAQIEGLVPYLDYLDRLDIQKLWELCNERGWFDLRRRHLDRRLLDDQRSAAFLDDGRAIEKLDQLANGERPYHLDYWLTDFLKTGRPSDSILSLVTAWFQRRADIKALEVAALAVIQIGRRAELAALAEVAVEPASEAVDILADASFALRRRSLA